MAAPFEASSLQPGLRVLGRYELVRELGRGGMGVVWLVKDQGLGIECAFKFLPDILRQDRVSLDELRDEARRNLRLTNEAIVRIYDFVEDATYAGITMEYVDGETLAVRKVNAPNRVLDTEELWPLVRQLCRALHYAHTQPRVVHRDLKPANLMVTKDGRLKITDFGIARSISDSITRVSNAQPSSGTLVYMSPQQLMGEPPQPTDDIYSVGATIYDLMTGKPPFHTGSVAAQLLQSVPPPMADRRAQLQRSGGAIPALWEETIAACLAKDASQRPATTLEIIRRLDPHATSRAIDPGETVSEPIVITPRRPEPAPADKPPATRPPIPATASAPAVKTAIPTPSPTRYESSEMEETRPSNELPTEVIRPAQAVSSPAAAPPRASGPMAWIVICTFLLLMLIGAVVVVGYFAKDYLSRNPNSTPAPLTEGSILLNTIPPAAKVWVDGKEIGKTPLRVDKLAVGDRSVHFERENYEHLDLSVEVIGGQTSNPGVLQLVPLPKKVPPPPPATPPVEKNIAANPSAPARPIGTPVPATPIPEPPGLSEAAARAVALRILETTEKRDFAGLLGCYTNPMDYFDEGVLPKSRLERSLKSYFQTWPYFDIEVLDTKITPTDDPEEKTVDAKYRFVAKSGGKVSSGIAHDTMTIRRYSDGSFARKIRQTVTDREKNF